MAYTWNFTVNEVFITHRKSETRLHEQMFYAYKYNKKVMMSLLVGNIKQYCGMRKNKTYSVGFMDQIFASY